MLAFQTCALLEMFANEAHVQKLTRLRCFPLLFFWKPQPCADYTGAIVGWVIGSIVLCGLIIYIGYTKCYKPFYTGQYNLNKTIHCCREHTPVPNSA